MRHAASLLASLEGMSRPAYLVAKELAGNSRSGLTVRFLSKKLELPEEEIEYILDINHRLVFLDLTKVKLVPEGHSVVKRITEGLQNHGDIDSLFRLIKSLSPHDFRRLEEQIGIDQPVTKKAAAEKLIFQYYHTPEAIVTYVATRSFSDNAREAFDILWQSKNGVMSISQICVAHSGSEYEVEAALTELFNGFALFEMFRLDPEDRLVRMAGLLTEIRQYRELTTRKTKNKPKLKVRRFKADRPLARGLSFSDTLCKLVATLAARPARLRGDGDLFREDRRRLSEICSEESEPSLSTCLWVAEGIGWLKRIDNTLRAGELEPLIQLDRIERHRILYNWLIAQGDENFSRNLLISMLDDVKIDSWYSSVDFIEYATQKGAKKEQPVLKQNVSQWEYVSSYLSDQTKNRLTRSLEESFFWLGIVERDNDEGDTLFRISELGRNLLKEESSDSLASIFTRRKGELIVQPNFDIVVPTEDMDPLLTVPLDQFADRTSTGLATVYNLSKDSFIQAVQESHDAIAFIDFLINHNREPSLPRNVMRTLEDWRGTMKRVRLRTVHILETDDPIILADLMHRKRLAKYFTPADPKSEARFKGISKGELAKLLEKDGFVVD